MKVKSLFTQADFAAIREAVREVEQSTSGEIVPYVVGASDEYEAVPWRAAALVATLAAVLAALVHDLGGFWGGSFALWLLVPPLGGGLLGYLAGTLSPTLRRSLTDPATLDASVRLRAEAAFLHEEVFRTVERTGVLIFLSILERRVVILGDSGINAKVEQHEWDGIVAEMVKALRQGRPVEALTGGITRCGRLLERRGVEIRPADRDELPDGLRTSDR